MFSIETTTCVLAEGRDQGKGTGTRVVSLRSHIT